MSNLMYKVIFAAMVFLWLPVSGINICCGNEGARELTAALDESQEIGRNNTPFPLDFPNVKGMIRAFAIVIGLMVIFFFFMKRRYGLFNGAKGNKRYIQVIEHLPLGPKRHIYLIRVLGKLLVVGATNDGLRLLSEMEGDEKAESLELQAVSEGGFSNLMKKARLNLVPVSQQGKG